MNLDAVPDEYPGALRAMLDAELALGNTIRSITRGFPAPASICVQLAGPFRARPVPVPPGVIHIAVNDPHWWMDEYRAGEAPDLLVG